MSYFKGTFFSRLMICWMIICLMATPVISTKSYAQVFNLPAPGKMLAMSPAFVPVMVKGLRVHPQNPLLFDFIVDTGKTGLKIDSAEFKSQSQKLIKYFLASLTIKEEDLWVNLSPYEKNRIIPQELGKTELGRDMLAQDYILKQLTASLIYPEKGLGKSFWDAIYTKARQQFGTTNIPVNTFNKVWIVADKAKVLEHNNTAFVVDAHLKVMMEEDYVALSHQRERAESRATTRDLAMEKDSKSLSSLPVGGTTQGSNQLGSQIVREIVLPELDREINQGQHFAPLRQMFYSMILASWYKVTLKDALLNQVYSNKAKTAGVLSDDPAAKEKIYQQYLQAYKKGVFNYIKEEIDESTQLPMPRKYFSGGLTMKVDEALVVDRKETGPDAAQIASIAPQGDEALVSFGVRQSSALSSDTAMAAGNRTVGSKVALPPVQVLVERLSREMKTVWFYKGNDLFEILTFQVSFDRNGSKLSATFNQSQHGPDVVNLTIGAKMSLPTGQEIVDAITNVVRTYYKNKKLVILSSDSEGIKKLVDQVTRPASPEAAMQAGAFDAKDEEIIKSLGLDDEAKAVLGQLKKELDLEPGWTIRLMKEFLGKTVSGANLLSVIAEGQGLYANRRFDQYGRVVYQNDFEARPVGANEIALQGVYFIGPSGQLRLILSPSSFLKLLAKVLSSRKEVVNQYFLHGLSVENVSYKIKKDGFSLPVSSFAASDYVNLVMVNGQLIKIQTKRIGRAWDLVVDGKSQAVSLEGTDVIASGRGFILFTQKRNPNEPVVVMKISDAGLQKVSSEILKKYTTGPVMTQLSSYHNTFMRKDQNLWEVHYFEHQPEGLPQLHTMAVNLGGIAQELSSDAGMTTKPKGDGESNEWSEAPQPQGEEPATTLAEEAGVVRTGVLEPTGTTGEEGQNPSYVRPDGAIIARKGGIDLNAKNMSLDVAKQGQGFEMKFDPVLLAEFKKGQFAGVEGIIFSIVPLSKPLMLLGLPSSQ